MPLIKPNSNENRDSFMSRCMGNSIMNSEYPDEKQRAGVCSTSWKENGKVGERGGDRGGNQDRPLNKFTESKLDISEAKLNKQGTKWVITIIESGESYNRFYYSEELLKNSTHIFEGIKVYTHKYGDTLDHRDGEHTNPNGMILNKVGWVENVRYKSDDGKGRLIGDFHCINSTLADMLVNTWNDNQSQMPEFSIDVIGNGYQEGMRKVVTEFKKANSLDMVSDASAGGKFERMVASKNKEIQMNELIKKLFNLVKEGKMKMAESIEGKTDDEITAMIKESLNVDSDNEKKLEKSIKDISKKLADMPDMKSVKEAIKEAIDESKEDESEEEAEEEEADTEDDSGDSEDDTEEVKDVKESVKNLKEQIAISESKIIINDTVNADPVLPIESKTRIIESLTGKVMKKSDVDKEIKKEKDYLEKLSGSGEIKINESTFVKITDCEPDRLQRAMDIMIDPELADTEEYKDTPQFNSMRESFERFVGMSISEARRISESGNTEQLRIKESTTANYPIALGTSMNKKMVKMYKMYKDREGWSKLVREETFNNLNQQDLSRFGGFGLLSTVNENAAYPVLSNPSEENPTYTPLKKGGYFYVTEEMIINDNLRAVRRFPQEMAMAGSRTLSYFVWGLITGCSGSSGLNAATIYDGGVLYTNTHGNLGATALTYASFDAGITAMNGFTQAGSSAPIFIDPKYLIVAPNNRRTALNICKNPLIEAGAASGAGSIKNVLESYGVEPIVVPSYYLCASTTAWILVADPSTQPTAVVGYLTGKKNPEILLQDNPTVATVFTNDRLTYRVKFRYGGAVEDWRGFYGYVS